MPPPTQADYEHLQALHASEHARRTSLETFFQRLALKVGQHTIDQAWAEMEARHGRQDRPEGGAAEGGAA